MNSTPKHIALGRPARAGQLILERRRRIVQRLLKPYSGIDRLLDLGCGNGAQSVHFTSDARHIIGIDRLHPKNSENPIKSERLVFTQGDGLHLPFADEGFNAVFAFEVLEHVDDDAKVVSEVARVLKPGGIFFYSLPSRWWLFESHGAVIPGFSWVPWNRVPFVSWLPQAVHRRIAKARIYTIKRARLLAERSGLTTKAAGYITAPLDVLPDGIIRRALRASLFSSDTTRVPMLAVNLFVLAVKEGA